MTAHASRPHYEIKLEKSRKLLMEFVDRYNAGRPLREQIRDSHLTLLSYLMYLYNLAIQSHQVYVGALQEGVTLPTLFTNNVQLAKRLGTNERTIINRRARLRAAGLIKREVFHGSNGQYELELAPWVIHLQRRGNPDNQVARFTAEIGRAHV